MRASEVRRARTERARVACFALAMHVCNLLLLIPLSSPSIVIVGYGVDPTWGPYWKIKNSWSENFGNKVR